MSWPDAAIVIVRYLMIGICVFAFFRYVIGDSR